MTSLDSQQPEAIAWLVHFGTNVTPALLADCRSILDETELDRCDRFRNDNARLQYILAHATLRRLLSSQFPTGPATWRFRTSVFGKPLIDTPQDTDLHFSLSHTNHLIACVASKSGPIGIDAEAIRHGVNVADFARILSTDEQAELRLLNGADLDRQFCRIWTAKEAYAKAVGSGITEALQQVSVSGPQSELRIKRGSIPLNEWALCPIAAGSEHSVTAAVKAGTVLKVKSFCVSGDQLKEWTLPDRWHDDYGDRRP